MPIHIETARLLPILDLAGTAVFAISGAAVGIRNRLDVFGVCVVAFLAGKKLTNVFRPRPSKRLCRRRRASNIGCHR